MRLRLVTLPAKGLLKLPAKTATTFAAFAGRAVKRFEQITPKEVCAQPLVCTQGLVRDMFVIATTAILHSSWFPVNPTHQAPPATLRFVWKNQTLRTSMLKPPIPLVLDSSVATQPLMLDTAEGVAACEPS